MRRMPRRSAFLLLLEAGALSTPHLSSFTRGHANLERYIFFSRHCAACRSSDAVMPAACATYARTVSQLMLGCELVARARWWKWCFATAGYDAVTRIQVSNTVFFTVVPPAPRIHTMPATRSSRSRKNCVLPSKQTTTNKSVYNCVPDAALRHKRSKAQLCRSRV